MSSHSDGINLNNRKCLLPTEEQEHLAFMQWASLHPVLKKHLIHIPNEIKCNKAYGAKRKRLGVKAGVSDFFLAYPLYNSQKGGLWLELKRKGGKLTKGQTEWILLMRQSGYVADVCFGFEDAQSFIERYLYQDLGSNSYFMPWSGYRGLIDLKHPPKVWSGDLFIDYKEGLTFYFNCDSCKAEMVPIVANPILHQDMFWDRGRKFICYHCTRKSLRSHNRKIPKMP